MNTIKNKVYLIVGIIFFVVIIGYSVSTIFNKMVEKVNSDLSYVLALKSQLSELILSEMSSIEHPDLFMDLKKRYQVFQRSNAKTIDIISLRKREVLLDGLFFSTIQSSDLHSKINLALEDLTNSIEFIHEHHIAYMKNLQRRGVIEQDYGDENFVRSDVRKASELDIIRAAVSIQLYLVKISNIFHNISQKGDSSNFSEIEKEFFTTIKEFFNAVNKYEDYSLDVQDGLLVEELLEKGRDFEKSFSSLISLEADKLGFIKNLNENSEFILQGLSSRIDELRQIGRWREKLADYVQAILLGLSILVMGSWIFYQGRSIEGVERSLKKTRERYQDLFDNNPSIILTHDTHGKIIDHNLSFKKEFGFMESEAIGMSVKDLINPKYSPDFGFYLDKVLEKGKDEGYVSVVTKSGEERILEYINTIVKTSDESDPYVQSSAKDITEQIYAKRALKESEAKLNRAKKMEALGLLAGGVAHDLNNILSGIVSYPELLLLENDLPLNIREGIETIKMSGDKAASIVNDLLTMARGVANVKETINLNDIINEFLDSPVYKKLIQFHSTVKVIKQLNTELMNITGSRTHIDKVIMNIVSNAVEALKEKGDTVIISTENRSLEKPLKGYDTINVGEYSLLIVSDNGPGISEEDLDRIFEPFYTKKIMGRSGTGLGLAVVWNTVQDHNGYINVISGEEGTTFELFFPITREEIFDKEKGIPIKELKGNGEKVLVVDDVEEQRKIACAILTKLDYNVTAVSSGEQAIDYLKGHTVDIIVLDMIMDPGMNGRETYEKIIKIHPGQKTIIASGFVETEEVKKVQKMGAGKFVKKPYSLEQIGSVVKEELNR